MSNELDFLSRHVAKGKLSRRDFLGRAAALGVSATLANGLLASAARAEGPVKGGLLKAGMQGGSAQCWQPTTRKKRDTSGNSPCSTSSTERHWMSGAVSLACLQEMVQVWQPTQRLTSTTMP